MVINSNLECIRTLKKFISYEDDDNQLSYHQYSMINFYPVETVCIIRMVKGTGIDKILYYQLYVNVWELGNSL